MSQRDQFTEFDNNAGPQGAASQDAPTEKEQMVPISRLNEANIQRDQANAQRDEIIKSMLNGSDSDQSSASVPASSPDDMIKVELPEGVDPDVAALLVPILEANNKAVYERMNAQVNTRVGPVEDKINYAESVQNVSSRVEGFDDVREDIVRIFEGMSPEERDRHNNEQGLELMALRALKDRASNTRARSDMAHSAPFGNSGMRPTQSRGATAQDVWDMTDEEFENLNAKQSGLR